MTTLTFNRDRHPIEVWHSIAGWVRRLIRSMKGLNGAPIEYAWVIEPHRDGTWPHVHMVTTIETCLEEKKCRPKEKGEGFKRCKSCIGWWRFVRARWAFITDMGLLMVDQRPVYDEVGAAEYLTKYLQKSKWTMEALAVMYRRRRWSTSRKDMPKKAGTWKRLTAFAGEAIQKWWREIQSSSRLEVTKDTEGLFQIRERVIPRISIFPAPVEAIVPRYVGGELGMVPATSYPPRAPPAPRLDPFLSPYAAAAMGAATDWVC